MAGRTGERNESSGYTQFEHMANCPLPVSHVAGLPDRRIDRLASGRLRSYAHTRRLGIITGVCSNFRPRCLAFVHPQD